jgi:hypothetical protein
MSTNLKDCKDLIGILLGPIRKRPALFLGEKQISKLPNFIAGYSIGYSMAKESEASFEKYFEEPGFLNWFYQSHNLEPESFWHLSFLEEANGNEEKALDLYFSYLEKYSESK